MTTVWRGRGVARRGVSLRPRCRRSTTRRRPAPRWRSSSAGASAVAGSAGGSSAVGGSAVSASLVVASAHRRRLGCRFARRRVVGRGLRSRRFGHRRVGCASLVVASATSGSAAGSLVVASASGRREPLRPRRVGVGCLGDRAGDASAGASASRVAGRSSVARVSVAAAPSVGASGVGAAVSTASVGSGAPSRWERRPWAARPWPGPRRRSPPARRPRWQRCLRLGRRLAALGRARGRGRGLGLARPGGPADLPGSAGARRGGSMPRCLAISGTCPARGFTRAFSSSVTVAGVAGRRHAGSHGGVRHRLEHRPQRSGAASAASAAPAASARRVPSSAGNRTPALGGRDDSRSARTTRPTPRAASMSASHSWCSLSCRDREAVAELLGELAGRLVACHDRVAGRRHHRAQVAEVELVEVGQGRLGPVEPLGDAEPRQQVLGQRHHARRT